MRKNQKNEPKRKADTFLHTVKEPMELLPFLLQTMAKSSRNSVKSILTRGQVTVNGKMVTQHNYPLQPGHTVAILTNQAALKESVLDGIEILHEDDDIIVITKDSGILSVAAKDQHEMTAYKQLKEYVKESNPYNKVFVVHRLDKDTSGIMLFAKSEDIKKKLQENWQEVVKERLYTTLVEGNVKKDQGKISSWLTESKTFKVYSSQVDNGGQHAITHYKKIRSNKNFTLLEVELETGRKNQIRVHMEELGHPVVGDKKYGSTVSPIKRLGLHATALALVHPRTGELMRFHSAAPQNFSTKLK
ncbi:RluA family pseudouridine synthase [Filibacter tadaridae]|uniref:Pseudouridine synthase n=1 Tax=Filibacter tadaridae TaxID=2483811 RepID=A0A3P5XZD2_9BACL|nr:RluA family pseudouridine synthase [Filibacter tadaridae]VDC33557.1 Ribosomal large subunit pseudouridine synthase D [Filibacter tadaridae]